MLYLITALVAVIVAANAYASLLALRSRLNDRRQKRAQLLFIWLIPVLGAFITIQVLKGFPRGSLFGRGGTALEPEQAWMYAEHGDDCPPGDTGCGE